MKQGHTYKAEYYGNNEWSILQDGREIVDGGLNEETAKTLVRAVNNHDALVSLLTEAANYMGEMGHPEDLLERSRATLKKAQE